MPAPIRIILTAEQEIILSETREAENLPQRTRDRAHMVRMNAQGWNAPKIALDKPLVSRGFHSGKTFPSGHYQCIHFY
jgi:hypothetical protein